MNCSDVKESVAVIQPEIANVVVIAVYLVIVENMENKRLNQMDCRIDLNPLNIISSFKVLKILYLISIVNVLNLKFFISCKRDSIEVKDNKLY
jgi:hypothetical protein